MSMLGDGEEQCDQGEGTDDETEDGTEDERAGESDAREIRGDFRPTRGQKKGPLLTALGGKTKRKLRDSRKDSNKRHKTSPPTCQDTSTAQLEQVLRYRCSSFQSFKKADQILSLLVRLYHAIGSPEAFVQLQDFCRAFRKDDAFVSPKGADTILQTLNAIDKLRHLSSFTVITRRYYLARFYQLVEDRKAEKTKEIRGQRQGKTRAANDENAGTKKGEIAAWNSIMAEKHPDLPPPSDAPRTSRAGTDEYDTILGRLKNDCKAGGAWHLLKQQFSCGILALVPVKGQYGILTSE
ncbi:hypothetical protein H2199_003959 [Coniosporium tulheliwenetii]|uniref:Uncharacterized protein n=1 Tax=Coniosporium tulheliwenetii TaxID=3383036 RepID=A0ACC2ZAE8_9PEZI|nr:hypothetical protein H2199_003959 [Cladosporium sp. JES 115]